MHVLFDTNVILDVLLNREPWVRESSALWRANDEGRVVGYAVASTFTDIFYICKDTDERGKHGLKAEEIERNPCTQSVFICVPKKP